MRGYRVVRAVFEVDFFFFLRRIPSSNRFFVFLFFWIETDGSNAFRTVFYG